MEGRAHYGFGHKAPVLDGFFVKLSYLFRL
jgi:hypothetical protein